MIDVPFGGWFSAARAFVGHFVTDEGTRDDAVQLRLPNRRMAVVGSAQIGA